MRGEPPERCTDRLRARRPAASVSTTSLGRGSMRAGAERPAARPRPSRARARALSWALALRAEILRSRRRPPRAGRAMRAAAARAGAPATLELEPACRGQAPALDGARLRRLALAQARRQRRRQHLAERVVVVVRRPAQQIERHRIEDRRRVEHLERALELRRIQSPSRVAVATRMPTIWRRPNGTRTRTPGADADRQGPRRAADSRRRAAAACRARFGGSTRLVHKNCG